ncbi:esterase-like activity of phytase family protein [Pleurocapsa sp. PCC 7319]|uniref:esterase-like activity of phytase family protein n=1 Tax=Pleurocapsa sp. PCC 7319 TaxID=118161 RepID=UPI000346337A|nr:esterase-like activity of phytase family protein [Pleurocapsa sp. PCC 7319]
MYVLLPKKTVSDRQVGFPLRFLVNLLLVLILFSLTACSPPQRVSATERMFRNFSLEFVDQYEISQATFKDTIIGGLSAIAYERQQDRFYVLSDDRGVRSPARFYTFELKVKQTDNDQIKIDSFKPKKVILLKDEQGQNFPVDSIDPEGLALSPRNTIFISSEGNPTQNIEPFIAEFDLETGKKLLNVRLPGRYLDNEEPDQPQGIQENLAFESLTINRIGLPEDPFRLFTATESALIQDESYEGEEQARIRLLHYVINPIGNPVLVAEHLYLLESAPIEIISNGLTELLALQTEGYFLSLERTFGFTGAGAKIFQVVIGNATDTSNISSLKGDLTQIRPLKKQLLFDLQELGIYLDNLEGMTLGPRLPDGSQSLLLISDDNFNDEQISQLLLFRLVEN